MVSVKLGAAWLSFAMGLTPSQFAVSAAPVTDSLASLDHIVLFMQENRAFDHYFGTMAGVRGFGDPNAVVSSDTNRTSFYSPVSPSSVGSTDPKPPPGVSFLLPWHFNHAGGDANDRYQCAIAGSNGWEQNHAAWDGGRVNKWATKNTPYSLGYYKREDVPLHFQLAEEFAVADAYHESVITSTTPNRISWVGGTVGMDQSKLGLGGPAFDNHETNGCETADDGSTFSCYPYKWKTLPEYLQAVGLSWQVYQDTDNFDDNPLAWFEQFIEAKKGTPLADRGMAFTGLERFYKDARAGTLPAVSLIIGPTDLSEHPPYGPLDGAWLQRQVVQALFDSPKYAKSALIVSYDETGGWADHVMSPHPDSSDKAEWVTDPYDKNLGVAPIGPGFRVPFYVVSPYTRRGGVFSELASHESQILFLEKWAAAKGKPFHFKDIGTWRRSHLSDLTRIFDFSKSDTSKPSLIDVRAPTKDVVTGQYNGAATCKAKYGGKQPDVPYTQSDADAWKLEKGFKVVRGNPSEGHFYVLATKDAQAALAFDARKNGTTMTPPPKDFSDARQRFVFFPATGKEEGSFFLRPVGQTGYLDAQGRLVAQQESAAAFTFADKGNGKGYSIEVAGASSSVAAGFDGRGLALYSVTY